MALYQRTISAIICVLLAVTAMSLFTAVVLSDGVDKLDIFRISLLAISTLWLSWGAMLSLNGLFFRQPAVPRVPDHEPLRGRTAILVPVYNEDPVTTFSRVAAMSNGLADLGVSDRFHFVVLSDTRDETIARAEEFWFTRLVAECEATGRMFYRRRTDNAGKKAGNIADFVTSSGGLYDYLLFLDADSLMAPGTIVELARRIEAEPKLGLLQTLPRIIHARSWFGRAMQFSAAYFSPVFAGGVATVQGDEGPFWGHNAIARTRAFAASCGLPVLSGAPPFGGHILSHDFVEAALLSRAGWSVRVDTDLEGSFEEAPENVIDYAKRDRRWCQGNLQHSRLLLAPGLKSWNRFVFLQGIMAYVASPIWLLFLVASVMAPAVSAPPNYFPVPHMMFPNFPHSETTKAVALLAGIFGLLLLPKFLILIRYVATDTNRRFGGFGCAVWSIVVEILWSSLLAPLMLMYQSRSVFQVLVGADGGWPAANRDDGTVSLGQAWTASRWIVVTGLVAIAAAAYLAPEVLVWLLPTSVPMLLAPFLIAGSSTPASGRLAAAWGLFATPDELEPSAVIRDRNRVLARWRGASEEIVGSYGHDRALARKAHPAE